MRIETRKSSIELMKCHGSAYLNDSFLNICVEKGAGSILYQEDGTEWLDMASGNFGYGVSEVIEPVVSQISSMALSNRILISRRLAELVAELDKICPGDIGVSYICNSGEEAFDGALKLCKGFNKSRSRVCVVKGSEFGTLSYALQFSDIGTRYLRSLGIEVTYLEPEDISMVVEQVRDDVLAIVFEPILFSHGIARLSSAYLNALREASSRSGSLMVDYEVRTGMGFSGSYLAIIDAGVVPDVVVVGGALSAGAIPVGAYVTKKHINDTVYGKKNPSLHGSTTGGNPASCAAAISAISYMKSKRLDEKHHHQGKLIARNLTKLRDRHGNLIKGVSSAGSFACIEMWDKDSALALWNACLKEHLILRRPTSAYLHLYPSLVVSNDEIQSALEIMSDAVGTLSSTPLESAAV